MVDEEIIRDWFCREVLPLERSLARFIGRNWRVVGDVVDLTHDVYELAIAGARREMPRNTRQYLFAVARNHLINRSKRARVVSFELIADLEAAPLEVDLFGTDRHLDAREARRACPIGFW